MPKTTNKTILNKIGCLVEDAQKRYRDELLQLQKLGLFFENLPTIIEKKSHLELTYYKPIGDYRGSIEVYIKDIPIALFDKYYNSLFVTYLGENKIFHPDTKYLKDKNIYLYCYWSGNGWSLNASSEESISFAKPNNKLDLFNKFFSRNDKVKPTTKGSRK